MTRKKKLRDTFSTVNPPVHRASTVLYDSLEAFRAADRKPYHGKFYGTYGSPVQLELEEALAELDGAHGARVCHSGFDAIMTVLMAFAGSGDHILVCDNVYGPTRDFCDHVLARYGVEVSYVPATLGSDVREYLRPNTTLVYLESPGSNTFELQDVPAVCELAREAGVVSVLDNTWATPLFFRPLDHGVDVAVQSVSKYVAGHSDALVGVIAAREAVFDRLHAFYELIERFAAPDACYAALKGLRTLGVRLQRIGESAFALATWLDGHPAVDEVLYPALSAHPQHHIWARDFAGASGTFAFSLSREPSEAELANFVNPMRHFALGLSWGGFQSLVKIDRAPERQLPSPYGGRTLVRLSVGLEDVDELREDLSQGLDRLTISA